MKNTTTGLCALMTGLLMATAAPTSASLISVPPSLSPGDTYRLIYLTTTTRDATSSDIADYNAFVAADAAAIPELAALGATWTAVASTSSVDARDNTGTNPGVSAGVPFYTLNGLLLADDNADLWPGFPGGIDTPVTDAAGLVVSQIVYTGSDADGLGFSGPLGAGGVDWGISSQAGHAWIGQNGAGISNTDSRPFYAMSSELTVAVPEASESLVILLGMTGLLGFRRRKR